MQIQKQETAEQEQPWYMGDAGKFAMGGLQKTFITLITVVLAIAVAPTVITIINTSLGTLYDVLVGTSPTIAPLLQPGGTGLMAIVLGLGVVVYAIFAVMNLFNSGVYK